MNALKKTFLTVTPKKKPAVVATQPETSKTPDSQVPNDVSKDLVASKDLAVRVDSPDSHESSDPSEGPQSPVSPVFDPAEEKADQGAIYMLYAPLLELMPRSLADRINQALWDIPPGATKGSPQCQKLRDLFIYEATRYITRDQYHPIDRMLRTY